MASHKRKGIDASNYGTNDGPAFVVVEDEAGLEERLREIREEQQSFLADGDVADPILLAFQHSGTEDAIAEEILADEAAGIRLKLEELVREEKALLGEESGALVGLQDRAAAVRARCDELRGGMRDMDARQSELRARIALHRNEAGISGHAPMPYRRSSVCTSLSFFETASMPHIRLMRCAGDSRHWRQSCACGFQ